MIDRSQDEWQLFNAAQIAEIVRERDKLQAEVALLKAPVSDAEMEAQRWMTDDEQFKDAFNAIIAARSEAKNV